MKEIQLTRGRVAIVDDEDFEWVSQWKWSAIKPKTSGPYAIRGTRRGGTRKYYLLHREILARKHGKPALDFAHLVADHIDHNGLNNTRQNLRWVTRGQNNAYQKGRRANNTSGYIGVIFDKQNKSRPWRSEIHTAGKNKCLGYFSNPIAAAMVRDMAAFSLRGEFAVLNFKQCEY